MDEFEIYGDKVSQIYWSRGIALWMVSVCCDFVSRIILKCIMTRGRRLLMCRDIVSWMFSMRHDIVPSVIVNSYIVLPCWESLMNMSRHRLWVFQCVEIS